LNIVELLIFAGTNFHEAAKFYLFVDINFRKT